MMFPFFQAEIPYPLAREFQTEGAALCAVSLVAYHKFTLALPDIPATSAGLFVCIGMKFYCAFHTLLLVAADHAPTGSAV